MDILGQLIKRTGDFKGKNHLMQYWMNHRDTTSHREALLPNGCRLDCDLSIPYEAMVWLNQEETRDLSVLSKLLKPGQVFVDCGANLGLWSITAAPIVGSTGKVYAFEPNPTTARKLMANINKNKLTNIIVTNSAAGAIEGTCFFQCEEAHNISSVLSQPSESTLAVSILKLDTVLKDRLVRAIKIDVEGYEIEVLKGAENILKTLKPWLCVEFNTLASGVSSIGEWEVHQFLTRLGYSACLMSHALVNLPSVLLQEDWSITGYCNLFYSVL